MTEETKTLWEFVFDAMTAFGTVGAVIISLVLVLWPKKRFKVHEVSAQAIVNAREIQSVGYGKFESCNLRVDIENFLEHQMQVFNARIHINDESSQIIQFQNSPISAKGRYHAKAALPPQSVKKGDFKSPKKIKVTIGTSFGDQTVEVSNPDTLRSIMESEDDYTAIDIGRA
jgi:hypothetical protein